MCRSGSGVAATDGAAVGTVLAVVEVAAGAGTAAGSASGSGWVSRALGRNSTARTPPYGDRVSTETLKP